MAEGAFHDKAEHAAARVQWVFAEFNKYYERYCHWIIRTKVFLRRSQDVATNAYIDSGLSKLLCEVTTDMENVNIDLK